MVVYNSLEYIFCYHDEKETFYLKLKDVATSRELRHTINRNSRGRSFDSERDDFYGRRTSFGSQINRSIHEEDDDAPECLPLVAVERAGSPTSSCDADVSSTNCDSDEDDLSSRRTGDTVVPRDTEATDFTNDEFPSEIDERRHVDDS